MKNFHFLSFLIFGLLFNISCLARANKIDDTFTLSTKRVCFRKELSNELHIISDKHLLPSKCNSSNFADKFVNTIDAVMDTFLVSNTTSYIGNVLTNDTLNGIPVTLSNTIVTPTLSTELNIDAAGNITLASGTPPGTYIINYFICEIDPITTLPIIPSNCDVATVTVTVTLPIICWKSFALGGGHTLAIKTDGTLWAWGRNDYGQLGDGTLVNKNSPIQIGTDTNWASISAGGYTSHAIKTDGTLWGCGSNGQGQIGNGTTLGLNLFTQIGTDTNWQKVSTGINHTLAIKTDGTLWAWGYNGQGQLGDNTTINKINPILIGTDTDWQSCDATKNLYSIAIKTSGLLYDWGMGNYGQLGNGSSSNIVVPTLINGTIYTTSFGGGFGQTIALRSSGIIDVWGGNSSGQLGDGTFIDTNVPNALNSDIDWVFTDPGYYFSLAKKSNGTIWTWGDNYFGQLGNGNNISTNLPNQINSDTDWDKVFVGYHHVIASKTDGTFWTWGWNQDGQLGNGTNSNSNTPIPLSCITLSIAENEKESGLNVYPNPVINIVTINSKEAILFTEIYEINGRLIQSLAQNNKEVTLNLENLHVGIYLLKITTDKASSIQKIIKK
jgi:alpha-tubulin suppressor-like RCC1 family protein